MILNKVKFYLKLIYTILAVHLSVYAVALARYEFNIASLDTKITNLITLSEGKNPQGALEMIPGLQLKVPIEPRVYNIFQSIKSLFPQFDEHNQEAYNELSALLAYNKAGLNKLNLSGFVFRASDFGYSNFDDVKLVQTVFDGNTFRYSKFCNVDLAHAKIKDADFAFVIFEKADLTSASLEGSNLCGAKFIDTKISHSNLKNSNLIGVDLSKAIIFFPEKYVNGLLENLHGAHYNSKPFSVFDNKQFEFAMKRKCHDLTQYPPTKFPEGFDPEAHGMIDISKW